MTHESSPGLDLIMSSGREAEARLNSAGIHPQPGLKASDYQPAFDGLPFDAEDARAYTRALLPGVEEEGEMVKMSRSFFQGVVAQALVIGGLAVQRTEVPSSEETDRQPEEVPASSVFDAGAEAV